MEWTLHRPSGQTIKQQTSQFMSPQTLNLLKSIIKLGQGQQNN